VPATSSLTSSLGGKEVSATISGRRARGAVCGPCGRAVITGVDADRCGLGAKVDPAPLTHSGELLAVIAGRWTYRLVGDRLCRRDRWSLRTAADAVHAEHRCHQPLPAAWLAPVPDAVPTPKELSW
jgi:hypothetical protein